MRRMEVWSHPGQIVHNLEKTHHKNRAVGVAQGEGPELKPQYHKKKKKKKKNPTTPPPPPPPPPRHHKQLWGRHGFWGIRLALSQTRPIPNFWAMSREKLQDSCFWGFFFSCLLYSYACSVISLCKMYHVYFVISQIL
jgi:hypothetical protein